LFHIVRHRGFKSTRRAEEKLASAEEREKLGEMKKAIQAIHAGWKASGCRTVAEYFETDEWKSKHGERRRNKAGSYEFTIGREDLIEEVKELFSSQRRYGSEYADEEFERQYIAIVDEPPRLLEGEELMKKVGKCFLEPSERRAPKATATAQKFIALQKLANQQLYHPVTGETRRLSPDETRTLMNLALKKGKFTYAAALKALGLEGWLFAVEGKKKKNQSKNKNGYNTGPEDSRKTQEEEQKQAHKETLIELKAHSRLQDLLAKSHPDFWDRLLQDDDLYDKVASILTYYLRPETTIDQLIQAGLSKDIAETLAYNAAFNGHVNLSIKAMRVLIPYLEQGYVYSKACELAGYDHSRRATGQKSNIIPPLDDLDDFNSITNPNVRRALTQARKVVNAIIREYGLPSRIGIELARDAALSPARKKEIQREQLANRQAKEAMFAKITECAPGVNPEKVWKKYFLYEQQGGKCAYSLKELDCQRVLSDPQYAEIDHAVPRSICFDDSMANKVLVLASENRNKGDLLAAVYVRKAHGEKHFQEYKAFVLAMNAPLKKKRLLLKEEITEEDKRDMQERYLKATQYAARYFARIIRETLDVPENRIICVNGRMTNDLRWYLGLGGEKDRSVSDKHHAIDATLCALADHKFVHRMARYFKARETAYETPEGVWITPYGEIVEMPELEPWPSFREDVLNALETMVVSRMPRRRATGRGHKDTIYSLKHVRKTGVELPRRGRISLSGTLGRPTTRVSLDSLSDAQIREILKVPSPILVDEHLNWRLYELIRERLRAVEHGSGGSWAERAFGPTTEPLRMPTNDGRPGPIVRAIRLYTDALSGVAVRGGLAENDSIVRLDIYRKQHPNGKVRHYVVPVYAADIAAGWVPNRAAVGGKPESEWPIIDRTYEFLFSLYPGDCFRVYGDNSDGNKILYVTSFNRNSVRIIANTHDRSNRDNEGAINRIFVSVTTALKIEKLHVDLLGRVFVVRREPRPLS
jgi:CRISPR-associated endonuclease Csn1